MTLMDDVLEELEQRHTYLASTYAPFYMCSVACHLFNLHNQKKHIYFEGRNLPSLRLHLLFVAPPGWMKTYFLETMIRGPYCILGNTVRKTFEATLTEAGLIGTIGNVNGVVCVEEGAAKEYADGIIGVDEFSAITRMMNTQHSGLLDTQLLSLLDSGYAYKRLAHGKIEYNSQFTLWGGVQPARYDLTSGMGRRFCFLLFLPSRQDAENLLTAWHQSKGIAPDKGQLEKLWRKLRRWKAEIKEIEKLEFDEGLLEEYKALGIYPFEGTLFDRLLLGWTLLKGVEKRVYVSMDDEGARTLVNREIAWRRQISIGGEFRQVLKLIEDAGGEVTRSKLMQDAFMLGWDLQQLVETLRLMERMRLVRMTKEKVVLVGGDR